MAGSGESLDAARRRVGTAAHRQHLHDACIPARVDPSCIHVAGINMLMDRLCIDMCMDICKDTCMDTYMYMHMNICKDM